MFLVQRGLAVEVLAKDPATNLAKQSQALREREFIPIYLFDGGRWTTTQHRNFPGRQATKGLLGMVAQYPELSEWVQAQIRSYSSSDVLLKVLLHRLQRTSKAHWEGIRDAGVTTYIPLTFKPGVLIPMANPWEREDRTAWLIVPIEDENTLA